MSFQQGLSGLSAASKNLDVIGNNVANAGTYGFKGAKAVFADIYAASLQGAGISDVGIGVKTVDVVQQFTQGNINPTNNPLDMAINGGGFFRLSTNGIVTYTRNGQFQMDKEGYLINATNQKLTGYPADPSGNINAGSPVEIKIDLSDIQPSKTTEAETKVNLDSRAVVPTLAFDVTDPTTFNYTTSMTVYDSLGNPRTFTAYYIKTADNAWEVQGAIDGTMLGAPLGNLAFNTDGTLDVAGSDIPMTVSATVGGGAEDPLVFEIDYTGSTQFGSVSSVNHLKQDGYTSGRLSGFTIGTDGTVLGRYSNGQSRNLAQVALANFTSPTGLTPLGDNQWAESPTSGQPLVGIPGSGSMGLLTSSALEESNVDLTQELVAMITAQRIYQANSQTIKTQDTILQTLVNLR